MVPGARRFAWALQGKGPAHEGKGNTVTDTQPYALSTNQRPGPCMQLTGEFVRFRRLTDAR
jgi:hypothetical protein